MRRIMSAALALGLAASSAFAADNSSTSPLSPGKPAGVKQADLAASGTLITIGLIAIGIGAGIIASQSHATGGNVAPPTGPTTTSTSP